MVSRRRSDSNITEAENNQAGEKRQKKKLLQKNHFVCLDETVESENVSCEDCGDLLTVKKT